MKILLVKYRNIGDVLLSTALIENLKIHYPNAQIDFALNDYCISMIKDNPYIDNIYSYRREYYKSLSPFKRIMEEVSYFKNMITQKYDIIINLTEGERGAYISLFSFKTKIKIGYELNNNFLNKLNPYTKILEKKATHIVKNDLNFLDLLDKKINSNKVSIFWSKEDEKVVDNYIEKIKDNFIQVHPVSRWMFKCWEDNYFAEIIDYLEFNKKIKVVITASHDKIEKDKVNTILALCKSEPLNLTGKLTLNQLAYLSSLAKSYIGIDSAPMHISAAVDTPVIALFGASNPIFWGPWENDNDMNFEFKDGVQKIGNHTILTSLDQVIFLEDGVKKSKGMQSIKVEEVKKVINEYF